MLEYLNRKESVLLSLKNGLTDKGYSFKTLAGLNGRLDLIKDIKFRYSCEILANLIENTNYPIMTSVKHGIDNVTLINKRKSDWYLYAINQSNISQNENEILRDSFLSKETLIYESEKNMGSNIVNFHVIFSKKKFDGKHEYIANKWQGR